MEIFLEIYANVPDKFIENFIHITEENYLNTMPSINLDIVAEWLDISRNNLEQLLIFFTENYDYLFDQENIIMITPDCLKTLCIMSKSIKGNEIKQYFISIEKLINEYHMNIREKLQNQITLLEDKQE